MWLEKQATTTMSRRLATMSLQHRTDAALARRVARAPRRSSSPTGAGARPPARLLGEAVQVGRPPVERRLVDLEVARVQDRAERRVDRDRHPVGDRVRHAQEPHRERPDGGRPLARRDRRASSHEVGHLVLLELALQQRQRERGPVDRDRRSSSRSRYGSAPMWSSCPWVSTTASISIGPLADVVEVRQDEVDAGHVRRRERQADVDDEDAVVQLEAGHVPADLADASEEDDADVGSEETGVLQRLADPRRAPPRSRGRAGAEARRAGRPSISRAAFTGIGLDVMNSALNSGDRSSWILRAAGTSPVSISSIICRIWGPTRWLATLTTPDRAQADVAERRPVVAE